MKKKFFMLLMLASVLIAAGFQGTASGDTCNLCHGFNSSLHHSYRGMEYWYSAENGGLEKIIGVSYGEFTNPNAGCRNCHKPGETAGVKCATCHGEDEPTGAPTGDVQGTICLGCHAREIELINREASQPDWKDVHRALPTPMVCTDCHSSEEMHGDGNAYISLKEPGAMNTKCENCHPLSGLGSGYSHSYHTTTLNCQACHQRRVVSCYNCHMDTAAPYGAGARVARAKFDDWVFLINGPDGKVTSANMQTFVGGDHNNVIGSPDDKTALMFAPVHSHSIMNPGRTCNDCHGTPIMKRVYNKRNLNLTWLDVDGTTLLHQTGVIPVAAGTVYKFIAYDKDNTLGSGFTWTALSTTPQKPNLKQYKIAFGVPLTRLQMNKLRMAMP